MMPCVGDIYFCKRIQGDLTSDHPWVLMYVNDEVVRYVAATSQVDPFLYRNVKKEVLDPERQPDSAVFLNRRKIKGADGSLIFSKPTILNCYHPLHNISRQNFDERVEFSLLEELGSLPDHYLAQIIPSVVCSGTKEWDNDDIIRVLDMENGLVGVLMRF